jgi:hypothetical protein
MRESLIHIMISMQGDTDLFQVIYTLDSVGRFADFLNSRQKEGDQDCDNGDDHQQLDECKPGLPLSTAVLACGAK